MADKDKIPTNKTKSPSIKLEKKKLSVEVDDNNRNCKKVFCSKWLEIDILKQWLIPHENVFKAKCIACNKVLNAGKSELIKHASGLKHEQNMLLTNRDGFSHIDADSLPNSMIVDEANSSRCEYVSLPETSSPVEQETQTRYTGDESPRDESPRDIHMEKQLEYLSRIASAVERIADSQETLAACKVLHKPS